MEHTWSWPEANRGEEKAQTIIKGKWEKEERRRKHVLDVIESLGGSREENLATIRVR